MRPIAKTKDNLSTTIIWALYRRIRKMWKEPAKAVKDTCHYEYCGMHIIRKPDAGMQSAMTEIHNQYTRIMWKKRTVYSVVSSMMFPFSVVVFALLRTCKNGPKVKKENHVGMTRQFFDQIYIACRHFITPGEYYFYRLHDPGNRRLAQLYVVSHEILPLMEFLHRDRDTLLLDDKRCFFEKCVTSGLPAIPVYAEFEKGVLTSRFNGRGVPEVDLVAKPARGRAGQGVKFYRHEEGGCYRSDDGSLLTAEMVLAQVSELSRKKPYILQERIFNHASISEIATEALCTARIVTGRAPGAAAEHLVSIFKIPGGGSLTDNFLSGGIAVSVDEQTGELGWGITKYSRAERIYRHPDSGCSIAGFRLPFWRDALQLCLRAHNAFSDFAFIGWDVAITGNGPVLVEGNLRWGVESMQCVNDRPIGATQFADVFSAHADEKAERNSGNDKIMPVLT